MPVRAGIPLGSLFVVTPPWLDYQWIAVFGGFACFWSGWTIGANNLANAFGSSVGSKTFTMFQACMVGTVMELVGAMSLGNAVTDIIAGSIARPSYFQPNPEIYMFGMLCSLLGASLWVTIATYFELGCSTTHSIIGAVLSISLVWGGPNAVVWADPIPGFPFYKGLIPVVASWFVAPVSAASFAAFTFLCNRHMILRRENSTLYAFWALPGLVFKTIIIDMLFILYRGAGTKLSWTIEKCAWVAVCVGAGAALFTIVFIMPMLWMKLKLHLHNSATHGSKLDTLSSKALSNLQQRAAHEHTAPTLGRNVLLAPGGKFISLSSPNTMAQESSRQSKARDEEEVRENTEMLASVKEWLDEIKGFVSQNARPLFASIISRVSRGAPPPPNVLASHATPSINDAHDRPSLTLELNTVYEEPEPKQISPASAPSTLRREGGGGEGGTGTPLRRLGDVMGVGGGGSVPAFARVTFEDEVQGGSLNSSQAPRFESVSYRSSQKTDNGKSIDTVITDKTVFEGVQVFGVWDKVYAAKDAVQEEKAPTFKERTQTTLYAWMMAVKAAVLHGMTKDIHADLENNEQLVAMHQGAEIFEPKTEYVYKYLQMFSAACVSFAHGAKDSANAAGPYSAIWYIYNNMAMPSSSSTSCPTWILALAAMGIVIGLNTYGYKMIRVLGVKLSKMTPSRGYSAELSVALVVSVFTYIQLPISTTHCIFGAEIGVGMCESFSHGTNWPLFARTVTSWFFTVFISGAFAALFFSAGGYAPSIIQSKQIDLYDQYSIALAMSNWALLNASNANTNGTFNPHLQALIRHNMNLIRGLYGYNDPQTFGQLMNASQYALWSNSLIEAGFNVTAPIYGRYDNVSNVTLRAYPRTQV